MEGNAQISAAGSIVERDGKILLVQEKRPELHELWNIPMGERESKEDPEDCAKREGKEETGFILEIIRLRKIYSFFPVPELEVICHVFRSKIIGGELTVPADMMDVRWFSLEEIEKLGEKKLLVTPLIITMIKDCREGKRVVDGQKVLNEAA